MSDEIKEEITKQLGVQPIMIDSADFSAQIRKRYYWTNIPVLLDYTTKNLTIEDIVFDDKYQNKDFSNYENTQIIAKDGNSVKWDSSGKGYYSQQNRARAKCLKMNTVTARGRDKCNIWLGGTRYRYIHPIEAERLQTLPDNYTSALKSDAKRIKAIGNGWTVEVISHILSFIPKE
jgi:DNA (cytosine-5)-methyltransferase 3A